MTNMKKSDFAKVGRKTVNCKTVKDKTNKIVRYLSTFFQEVILRVPTRQIFYKSLSITYTFRETSFNQSWFKKLVE